MFEGIETPALLLEAEKLERNCRRMRERVHAAGVMLRPHVKTAKSVDVAQLALDAPAGPITVSTLREAEYFFDHGFRDILYAVGMVPAKVPRLAELSRRGARVGAIVDSVEAARALREVAAAEKVRIATLIEIDSDGHRAGVAPGDARLVAIAEALGDMLAGVMTHAGESYNCPDVDAIRAMATREREAVVASANGSPSRRSNGEGKPSFFLTPTVSTPQCAKITAPDRCAAANTCITRSSSRR
jgi:D-serine deaminase-like pyridoxal phosphate-dependent protein